MEETREEGDGSNERYDLTDLVARKRVRFFQIWRKRRLDFREGEIRAGRTW